MEVTTEIMHYIFLDGGSTQLCLSERRNANIMPNTTPSGPCVKLLNITHFIDFINQNRSLVKKPSQMHLTDSSNSQGGSADMDDAILS